MVKIRYLPASHHPVVVVVALAPMGVQAIAAAQVAVVQVVVVPVAHQSRFKVVVAVAAEIPTTEREAAAAREAQEVAHRGPVPAAWAASLLQAISVVAISTTQVVAAARATSAQAVKRRMAPQRMTQVAVGAAVVAAVRHQPEHPLLERKIPEVAAAVAPRSLEHLVTASALMAALELSLCGTQYETSDYHCW